MMEQFPQEDKKWSEGCIYGMKYLVGSLICLLNNPKEQAIFEKMLGWEETVKKMMGEDRYKMMKEHEKKMGLENE